MSVVFSFFSHLRSRADSLSSSFPLSDVLDFFPHRSSEVPSALSATSNSLHSRRDKLKSTVPLPPSSFDSDLDPDHFDSEFDESPFSSPPLKSSIEPAPFNRKLRSSSFSSSSTLTRSFVLTLPRPCPPAPPNALYRPGIHLKNLFVLAKSLKDFESAVKFLTSDHDSHGRDESDFEAFIGE